MKILFISTGHSLDDDRVTRKEAVSLARLGYDVTVCAQYEVQYEEHSVRMMDVQTLAVVDGKKGPDKKSQPGRAARCLLVRQLYRAYKIVRPDLVVAHEFESAVLAHWIKARCGTPYVFDAHEAYEETIPSIFPAFVRRIMRKVVRKTLRMIVRDAEGVTAAVPRIYAFEEARRRGIASAILYNSPWLEYFPFSDETSEPIRIFHEGNLSLDRGALVILEALALVRRKHRFKFVVIGKIQKDAEALFLAKINALGLDDVVEIRGYLPWHEFGVLESKGQIGLCCLQRTHNCVISLACKLFSYSACGLAIVGLKDSETENFIKDAQNGICVDTSSPEEIANAICYLIEHPAERVEMVRNGRRALEQRYCWERMEEIMRDFYGKISERLMRK